MKTAKEVRLGIQDILIKYAYLESDIVQDLRKLLLNFRFYYLTIQNYRAGIIVIAAEVPENDENFLDAEGLPKKEYRIEEEQLFEYHRAISKFIKLKKKYVSEFTTLNIF